MAGNGGMKLPLGKGVPGLSPLDLLGVGEVLTTLTNAITEYGKVVEQEKTKRLGIEAQRDVMLEHLRGQKEVVMTFLQASFRERAYVLDKSFGLLDRGIETGDPSIMQAALTMIVTTVQHSPFKDARDLTNKLSESSFVLKLD